jgi:TolA-binding protein
MCSIFQDPTVTLIGDSLSAYEAILTAAPSAVSMLSGAVVMNELQDLLQSSSACTGEPVKKSKSAYHVYEWIVRTEAGLFCKYCSEFASSNQSNKGAWIAEPFTRVRDLYERATKHNMSQGYKNAAQAFRAHLYTTEPLSVVQQIKLWLPKIKTCPIRKS